jgi:hypothetical protein
MASMSSVLDPAAPGVDAEYARYIDGDLLGKIIARNLLTNVIGHSPADIFTPIGRYGDADVKYADASRVASDPGDGHVETAQGRVTFEIKLSRLNMGNRKTNQLAENWAFQNILRTPGRVDKRYDILIAIGLNSRGLEDREYWQHLKATHAALMKAGHPSNEDAMPHEREFLSRCSFFVLPRKWAPTNFFRINVHTVERKRYGRYRAWGHDEQRCRAVWNDALKGLAGA